MTELNRQAHWQNVYATKRESEGSWFQESPSISLELIRAAGRPPFTSILDVGGGASRLPDALLAEGYKDVTVLDISEAALSIARSRLGPRALEVTWVVADVTKWSPARRFDVWHDRATLHFLTEAADRFAYVQRLYKSLRPGGTAIIGTFSPDGPENCSGLPVVQYDPAKLTETVGSSFGLVRSTSNQHMTPSGSTQLFQFSVFRRG